MCDELLFFCHNWIETKNSERHSLNHNSMCCHILNILQALCSPAPSMSGLWNGQMAIELLHGWKPLSSTLDCWLGHLTHWQITRNWPLLGLNYVYYVWLSGYMCVTTHFHHSDLHSTVCCHISCCKVPILHSSFYQKKQEPRVLWAT